MAIRRFIPGEKVEPFLAELSQELATAQPTTDTFVAPRLTSIERSAITTPATGTIICNTTTGRMENYTTSWLEQVLSGDTFYVGTTSIALNRASAPLTLAGLTLTTPNIGAATGTSLLVSGTGGIGYAAGAGGAATQGTSRTTSVTLNTICGTITMYSAAQAADALVTFTFSNSCIASADFLLVQHISATNGGAWGFSAVCGSGSATISVRNLSGASITESTPLRFTIIKGVVA